MCGRASLTVSLDELEEAFGISNLPAAAPRYNIAPTERILAIRGGEAGARDDLPPENSSSLNARISGRIAWRGHASQSF